MIFWKQQLKVRRLFNICLRSKCNSLLDHTNYVLYKRFENIHYNTLTRSSWRIFNPMRYTGFIHSSSCSFVTITNHNLISQKINYSSSEIFHTSNSFLLINLFLWKPFLYQSEYLEWTYSRYYGKKMVETFFYWKKKCIKSGYNIRFDIRSIFSIR